MQDNKLLKISASALFAVFAAICGILEGMLPLHLLIPIPGVKLGIANIFIIFAFKIIGASYALAISVARTALVFIFTGNSMGLILSLFGATMSYISLCIMIKFHGKAFTYIGISALSAVFHGIGQLAGAYIFIGGSVTYYLPVMLIACTITGIFTGTLMNISENKISSRFKV